jgi:hypothetical protein
MEVLEITFIEEKSILELLCTFCLLREKLKNSPPFQVCNNPHFKRKSSFLFMKKGIFFSFSTLTEAYIPLYFLFFCTSAATLYFGAAKCAPTLFWCAWTHYANWLDSYARSSSCAHVPMFS